MAYWLMKSEPDEFSIKDLQKIGEARWDGVRNYQARNFMRAMAAGDEFFFYHSSCPEPGIAGIGRIVQAAYPDPTALDPESHYFDPKATPETPRWFLVDVAFERKFKQVIALEEIRQHAETLGEGFALTARGSRLSVFPVTSAQWKLLLGLEQP